MAKAPAKKTAQPGFLDQIAKLSKLAKVLIVFFTAVALGCAFYFLVYVPYEEEAQGLTDSIAS
ncbi:MAG: hypothetical protein ACRCTY_03475, partial [Candidatus Adiutrix sp.]